MCMFLRGFNEKISEFKRLNSTLCVCIYCNSMCVFIYGGPGLRLDNGRSSPESWSGRRGLAGCHHAARRTAPKPPQKHDKRGWGPYDVLLNVSENMKAKKTPVRRTVLSSWTQTLGTFPAGINRQWHYVRMTRNWLTTVYLVSKRCSEFWPPSWMTIGGRTVLQV